MIEIVWVFEANPKRVEDFERHYGSEETWAQMFRRAPGFAGTTMLRDAETPYRYLVIDRWNDRASFERFKQEHRADYEALDKECEALCVSEVRVGIFEER